MPERPITLRSLLALVTVVVTVVVILIAGGLVGLTSVLHRTTVTLGAAIETVRLAEEAEIDLLLHGRADDSLVRRDIEGNLRRKLSEITHFANGPDEQQALREATRHVNTYLKAASARDRSERELAEFVDAAFSALDEVVNRSVAHARSEQRKADRVDYLANMLGVFAGVLLLLAAALLLNWLRVAAFRPIFRLAQAMERFGKGDRSARAEESGPAELRDMAQRFNEMATAISGQRDAQTAFLAGVAHDLRNPLSALQMSLATMRPEDPLPPEPRLRRVLAIVNRQIWRLERMIGDFLDMAKIEAGQLELRLEQCDARQLVRQVVELFEASSSGHELELSLPDNPVNLKCDPLRIEQVISNLISNAIKYSPGGKKVVVRLERIGTEVVLTVIDRGVGISKSEQQHLFEPFRRMGLSRELVPGVGLGLFVVRRIVSAHNGRISMESALGSGSTFRVHLPALQNGARGSAEAGVDIASRSVAE